MISLPWIPLGLIGILSWSVWFIRRWLSRHRYEPVVNDFRTTTSIVVPVYRGAATVGRLVEVVSARIGRLISGGHLRPTLLHAVAV